MPLYRALLGPAWDDLGEPLRRLHAGGRSVRAAGRGEVAGGETAALRALGRLLGLPHLPAAAAAAPAEIRLEIVPEPAGERWLRHLGGSRVESWEFAAGGLLAERFRGVELRFQLRVEGAGLRFEQVAAGLRCGPFRLPLPRPLAPRVDAHDVPGAGPDEVRFAVTITLCGRRLLGYAGTIQVEAP